MNTSCKARARRMVVEIAAAGVFAALVTHGGAGGLPQESGACCLVDGGCVELEPGECAAQEGTFLGAGTT